MWWPSQRTEDGSQTTASLHLSVLRRLSSVVQIVAISALTAGCFQPLYGDRGPVGGQGMRQALSSVDVANIDAPNGTHLARLAVEVRNALLFDLTGGSAAGAPTHRLKVRLSTLRQSVIVDITTARPDIVNYGVNASYSLVNLSTGKTIMKGATFARVSADIPGQEQRFARQRGERDAESRAAKVIAENIRARLASYFVAGT
jgi:LPS-assembly lipoprotein